MKKIWNLLVRKWNNYLKRLGKINKELYGSGPLDCCKLNHDDRDAGKRYDTAH